MGQFWFLLQTQTWEGGRGVFRKTFFKFFSLELRNSPKDVISNSFLHLFQMEHPTLREKLQNNSTFRNLNAIYTMLRLKLHTNNYTVRTYVVNISHFLGLSRVIQCTHRGYHRPLVTRPPARLGSARAKLVSKISSFLSIIIPLALE